MAGYLYDGGGSDDSGLAIIVRTDAGYDSLSITNTDNQQVWSLDPVPGQQAVSVRITGLSTSDLPLTLIGTTPPGPRHEPIQPPTRHLLAKFLLPTIPSEMFVIGTANYPDFNVNYLLAAPGRTSPIHGDVLTAIATINGLADTALTILALLVVAKARRDIALSIATVNGAIFQALAAVEGAGLQAAAADAAGLAQASTNPPETDAADALAVSAIADATAITFSTGGITSTLATINAQVAQGQGGSDDYVSAVGAGGVGPNPTATDYLTARQQWLQAKQTLFNQGNYFNPNWFQLTDVPAWVG